MTFKLRNFTLEDKEIFSGVSPKKAKISFSLPIAGKDIFSGKEYIEEAIIIKVGVKIYIVDIDAVFYKRFSNRKAAAKEIRRLKKFKAINPKENLAAYKEVDFYNPIALALGDN